MFLKTRGRLSAALLTSALAAALGFTAMAPAAQAADTNLIANASAETVASTGTPTGWTNGSYSITAQFSVGHPGHTGNNAACIATSAPAGGDAKWFTPPVTGLTAGTSYTLSLWRQSTVTTEADALETWTDGTTHWVGFDTAPASTGYGQLTYGYTPPAKLKSVVFAQIVNNVTGTLCVDDYSLTAPGSTPTPTPTTPTPTPAPTTPPPAGGPVSPTAGQIANGGLETIDATSKLPTYWAKDSWGAVTGTTTSVTTAHSGSKAVRVETTSCTAGAGAMEVYQKVPVTPGKSYKLSAWVATNTNVQLGVQAVNAAGTEIANSWASVANVTANSTGTTPTTWKQAVGGFTAPSGAAFMQILVPVCGGWVVTDDYSLTLLGNLPAGFSQGYLVCNQDDGWLSQSSVGLAIRAKYGIKCTDFIISDAIGTTDYMSATQIKELQTKLGDEIANHSKDHGDPYPNGLVGLTAAQLNTEMTTPQTVIKTKIGVTPTTFAMPLGAYDDAVLAKCQAMGLLTCRSTDAIESTYSTMGPSFFVDPMARYRLMSFNVVASTKTADLAAGCALAKAQKLIFNPTFHEVVKKASDAKGGDQFYRLATDFDADMKALQACGLTPTTATGLWNAVSPQLAAAGL